MQNQPIININAMDCDPATEEEFNTWYSETHIPMLFKSKGMKKVARYKRIGDDEKLPKYLAIYSFDSLEDFEEYSTERAAARSTERVSASEVGVKRPEGIESRWLGQYELIKSWGK